MKNILITGASRGIGRAIAEILADPNTRLYLHGRNEKKLEETKKMVEAKGASAELILAELSDENQITAIAQNITCQQLDVLIHNAGISIVGPFQKIELSDWRKMFDVNVTAPFLLTKLLYPKLVEGSSVVNILSGAAKSVFTDFSGYCMTKFALNGFMRTVREEMRSRRVRVINVYPGSTETDIWDGIPGNWDRSRMMKPESIARAVKHTLDQPQGTLVEDITVTNLGGVL